MTSELLLFAAGSFVIALSGALMPGPLLSVTISESAKRGAKTGPLLMVGHGILEGALVAILFSGLSTLMARSGFMASSFLLGGVILFVMGVSMMRESATVTLDVDAGGQSRGGNIVLLGVLGSLANPYWIVWWATVGLGYLFAGMKVGIPGVIAFFAGHVTADFAWYALVSLAVARGGALFPDKIYRRLIFGCGAFLLFFGGWFLSEGVNTVLVMTGHG